MHSRTGRLPALADLPWASALSVFAIPLAYLTAGHEIRAFAAAAATPADSVAAHASATETPAGAPRARPAVAAVPTLVTAITPCRTDLILVGAVRTDDPRASLALMSAGDGGSRAALRVGDPMLGRSVSQIGWSRMLGAYVLLLDRRGGSACFIAQNMPRFSATAAAPPAVAVDVVASAVTITAPGRFVAPRSLVDRIRRDPSLVMTAARIEPALDAGRMIGMRIAAIRPEGVVARLGLRAGDVLLRVNGIALDGPDRMLEAYMRLQSADEFRAEVLRNGAPLGIEVEIR